MKNQLRNESNSNIQSKRNGAIDFWRFIFSVIIVCFHGSKNLTGSKAPFFGGAIAVEFFFLVSGFLMAASVGKYSAERVGESTRTFLFHKIKGVFPEVLMGWCIGFIVKHWSIHVTLAKLVRDFFTGLWELFFLRQSGFAGYNPNAVTWYLSSMLLAMFLLFPLLLKNKDTFINIIAPLLTIFLLGYLCITSKHLRKPTLWLGFCTKGTLRAVAEVCLGCICWAACQKLKSFQYTPLAKALFAFIELGGYICIVLYSNHFRANILDFAVVFLFAICITITFSHLSITASLFDNKVCYWLGKISLALYVSHAYWSHRLPDFFPDYSRRQLFFIYIIFAACTTAVIYLGAILIRKVIPKLRAFIVNFLIS